MIKVVSNMEATPVLPLLASMPDLEGSISSQQLHSSMQNVKPTRNINPVQELNLFKRRKQMEQVANKLLKGKKATVAMKVFQFFLSNADNTTGVSRHSIQAISQYISYCKQWAQEGINTCVKAGLIKKTHRGLRKTNLYEINYELLGKHSYKPHKCSEGVSVAGQSALKSKNISITTKSTSFDKNVLGFSLKEDDQRSGYTGINESLAADAYKERSSFAKVWKKWSPDPANKKEESEFFKEFSLSEKSNRILESNVSGGYLISSQYRLGFYSYIKNNRPPFNKYGEFWNHRNINQYFPLWLGCTLKMKTEVESQGKRFFHYHDRVAYKENKQYKPRSCSWQGLRSQAKVQVETRQEPQAGCEMRGGIHPLSIAMTKAITNIQFKKAGVMKMETSSYSNEITARIEQETDQLRQGVLKVCAEILPDVVFLKAEKTLNIMKTEDEDEITFDIFMEGIYSYEHKIRTALQEALVSAKGKRVYVRLMRSTVATIH